jgi:sugar phosphate isomerase/epimerase
MKLGAYTACLHDKSLEETLTILRELGLDSAEINAGGFIGTPHLPVEDLLASEEARQEYLAVFPKYGIELTALNCNGNPLHPDPEVHHAEDLKRTIRLAGLLGIKTVITMSGLPAAEAGGSRPSWTVIPWDSVYKETLDPSGRRSSSWPPSTTSRSPSRCTPTTWCSTRPPSSDWSS